MFIWNGWNGSASSFLWDIHFVILMGCILFLPLFLDVIRMSMSIVLSSHTSTLEFSVYIMLFFNFWSNILTFAFMHSSNVLACYSKLPKICPPIKVFLPRSDKKYFIWPYYHVFFPFWFILDYYIYNNNNNNYNNATYNLSFIYCSF